jgi:hypothetical protein
LPFVFVLWFVGVPIAAAGGVWRGADAAFLVLTLVLTLAQCHSLPACWLHWVLFLISAADAAATANVDLGRGGAKPFHIHGHGIIDLPLQRSAKETLLLAEEFLSLSSVFMQGHHPPSQARLLNPVPPLINKSRIPTPGRHAELICLANNGRRRNYI